MQKIQNGGGPAGRPILRRQMAYDPNMNAREYFRALRDFNNHYGYPNNNVPTEEQLQDIPEDITIGEYQALQNGGACL